MKNTKEVASRKRKRLSMTKNVIHCKQGRSPFVERINHTLIKKRKKKKTREHHNNIHVDKKKFDQIKKNIR